ncbi:MAG: hypothetical protein ACR2HZ_09780 [Gemmatimonadaceae bacterium]
MVERSATVRWDTLYLIGGSAQDTLLLLPRLLASHARLLYVYDYSDAQVKAFDESGHLRWRFGRKGAGPGEFRNAWDLVVGPSGDVWVLDASLQRLTVVSPRGQLVQLISLKAGRVKDVISTSRETLGVVIAPDEFLVTIDSTGAIAPVGGLPMAALRDVQPTIRQTISSGAPDGLTWASTFLWGRHILVFRGRTIQCRGELIGAESFPETTQGTRAHALAIAVDGASVFVLRPPLERGATSTLDEYSVMSCEHTRTVGLPGAFYTMAASDGVFFLEKEDPAPMILALQERR